jgi:hypothetical protein
MVSREYFGTVPLLERVILPPLELSFTMGSKLKELIRTMILSFINPVQ